MNIFLYSILILFSLLIGGSISILGIYLRNRFSFFNKAFNKNTIIIMFLLLILTKIILSGTMLFSIMIGEILATILIPFILSLTGIVIYKIVSRFRTKNSNTTFGYNFMPSIFFPLVLQFLVIIRSFLY